MDPRVDKLARILVRYSLKLKKGQLVKIVGEVAGLPLVKAVFREAIEIGAHPYVQIRIPDKEEALMKNGSDQQVCHRQNESHSQKTLRAWRDYVLHE